MHQMQFSIPHIINQSTSKLIKYSIKIGKKEDNCIIYIDIEVLIDVWWICSPFAIGVNSQKEKNLLIIDS